MADALAPRRRRGALSPASDRTDAAAALLDALRAVSRELRVAERDAEQLVGLHPAQLHTLRQLADRPARSLAELADRTHTDPSSASVVVQRLVERGLVVRTPAAEDRRRVELSATATGRALLRRVPAPAPERLQDAISSLGEQRASTLVRQLAALARALQRPADEPSERD